MNTLPVRTLFFCIAVFFAIDLVDAHFVHWSGVTPGEAADRAFWESMVVATVWLGQILREVVT